MYGMCDSRKILGRLKLYNLYGRISMYRKRHEKPVLGGILGSSRIIGIKQSPFLADAVMVAFIPFPMDCSIILLITMNADNGSTQA